MNGDFELGDWTVHPKLNAVVRDNTSRHLSPKAGEVLVFLARHQGDVVSKEDILAAVWPGTFVTDDALTRCIGELRRVFEDDAREPSIIQTIAKRGYRLVPPVRWLGDECAGRHNGGTKADEESGNGAAGTQPPTASLEAGRTDTGPAGVATAAGQVPAALSSRVSRRVAVAAAAITLVAGVIAGVTMVPRLRPAPVPGLVVSTIDLEPGYVLAGRNSRLDIPTRTAMAISSDGSFVVYAGKREGTQESRLFLRRLTELRAASIDGTEGAIAPFLSPDNRQVGFVANRKLKSVPIAGGPVTELSSPVSAGFGATWGSGGYIAISSGFDVGLTRVRAGGGGAPEILTKRLPGEFHHRLPHYLPRGKGVLFTVAARPQDPHPRIAVADETLRTRIVLDDAADARYVPTGHLVFVRQGSLMAVNFDLDRLRAIGDPVSVGLNVAQALNEPASTEETDAGQFAVSDAGALVYVAGRIAPDEQHSLVWVDQDGREAGPAVPFTAPFMAARLSSDGRKIAYTVAGMRNRVCVYDLTSGSSSDLTNEGRVNFAIWKDSRRVVFGLSTSGPPNLFERPIDQSAPPQALTADMSCTGQGPGSFSPDGNHLAFWRQFPDKTIRILVLDRNSGGTTPFVVGRPGEFLGSPEFSPDGRWLAYTSSETGRLEVYVRAYPNGGKWPISSEGGTEPLWSRNGKRLFYRSGAQVWAVDLEEAAELRRGRPRLLFSNADGYVSSSPGRAWDLSLDGRRFLMVRREEAKPRPVTQLVLVQNWTTRLERLFARNDRGQ